MSTELYVFMNKSDMPAPETWQRLITDSKFDLLIDTDFDPLLFSGFLPCVLDHQQTGFEFYFWPKEEIATTGTYLSPIVKSFDSVATFVWGGALKELVAVMMAAGSLASSCSSILHASDDDSTVSGKDALGYAREQIAEAEKFFK